MAESRLQVLAGEPMILLADRGLYWPTRKRLLIADLHLGKGHVFRSAGLPIPTGGTHRDLSRLQRLLAITGARSLWILGDFLHGVRNPAADQAWRDFRQAHAGVQIGVIAGNHDRAFCTRTAEVEHLHDGVIDGPFAFGHQPHVRGQEGPHWICGHLHPVVRIPANGRWPIFWLCPGLTVLPAFSAFTGGHALSLAQARGSVACNGRDLAPI